MSSEPRGTLVGFTLHRCRVLQAGGRWVFCCALGLSWACVHESEQRIPDESPAELVETSGTSHNAPKIAPDTHHSVGETQVAGQRVYDRVLVRPISSLELGEDALREAIARQVEAPIERISKGPMQWRVIVFKALDPPRDGAAQKELVNALRSLPEFEKVEADQLMFAK